MSEFSQCSEHTTVTESQLKYLSARLHRMLDEYGTGRAQYGESSAMVYRNRLTETFKLTATEIEFVESEQVVSIFLMNKNTGKFLRGVYVDVWTCLNEQPDDSEPVFWHKKRYGILDNGDFYSEDEFLAVGDSKPVHGDYQPIHDNLWVKGRDRIRQIHELEDQLDCEFTVYDNFMLRQVLKGFDAVNLLDAHSAPQP